MKQWVDKAWDAEMIKDYGNYRYSSYFRLYTYFFKSNVKGFYYKVGCNLENNLLRDWNKIQAIVK